eukprot:1247070-Prymnesium_polylepis.1
MRGSSPQNVYGQQCKCSKGTGIPFSAGDESRALAPYAYAPVFTKLGIPLLASGCVPVRASYTELHFDMDSILVTVDKHTDKQTTKVLNVTVPAALFAQYRGFVGNGSWQVSASSPLPGNYTVLSCTGTTIPIFAGKGQRCHVSLDGGTIIYDAGSANGGFVEGRPITVVEPYGHMPFPDTASVVEIPLVVSSSGLRETAVPYVQSLAVTVALDSYFQQVLTVRVAVAAAAVASRCTFEGQSIAPPPPPSGPAGEVTCRCEETCFNAPVDGYCDDGGPGSEYSVCALGSDCADCGTRAAPLEIFGAAAGENYTMLLQNIEQMWLQQNQSRDNISSSDTLVDLQVRACIPDEQQRAFLCGLDKFSNIQRCERLGLIFDNDFTICELGADKWKSADERCGNSDSFSFAMTAIQISPSGCGRGAQQPCAICCKISPLSLIHI